jgi:hypothetical protein
VVTLWDTANQPRQLGRLKAATFSGNLRVFATADDGKPILWEKTDPIRLDERGQVNGYANSVLRLSYEGDGLIMDSSEIPKKSILLNSGRRQIYRGLNVWGN